MYKTNINIFSRISLCSS